MLLQSCSIMLCQDSYAQAVIMKVNHVTSRPLNYIPEVKCLAADLYHVNHCAIACGDYTDRKERGENDTN